MEVLRPSSVSFISYPTCQVLGEWGTAWHSFTSGPFIPWSNKPNGRDARNLGWVAQCSLDARKGLAAHAKQFFVFVLVRGREEAVAGGSRTSVCHETLFGLPGLIRNLCRGLWRIPRCHASLPRGGLYHGFSDVPRYGGMEEWENGPRLVEGISKGTCGLKKWNGRWPNYRSPVPCLAPSVAASRLQRWLPFHLLWSSKHLEGLWSFLPWAQVVGASISQQMSLHLHPSPSPPPSPNRELRTALDAH